MPKDMPPDDGLQAAIDALLHHLYWRIDLVVERLITDLTSRGIYS